MLLSLFNKYRSILLYGVIGVFCSGLDFVVYSLLCDLVPFLVANIISTHVGIVCSFCLNRQYNFKIKDKVVFRFLSFYVVGLLGLLLSEALLYATVNVWGWNEMTAKLLSIVIVALAQFILNKTISFRKIKK